MNLSISKMNLEDLELVQDTLEKNFDDFWNEQILKNELTNPNSFYLVCKEDNEIVGFGGIWQVMDEAHITNIVTRIDKRRLGIASKILEQLISTAKEHNMSLITLEVNVLNVNAIRLYRKYDFDEVGIRKNYYNGNTDALIMTLLL